MMRRKPVRVATSTISARLSKPYRSILERNRGSPTHPECDGVTETVVQAIGEHGSRHGGAETGELESKQSSVTSWTAGMSKTAFERARRDGNCTDGCDPLHRSRPAPGHRFGNRWRSVSASTPCQIAQQIRAARTPGQCRSAASRRPASGPPGSESCVTRRVGKISGGAWTAGSRGRSTLHDVVLDLAPPTTTPPPIV